MRHIDTRTKHTERHKRDTEVQRKTLTQIDTGTWEDTV